MPDGTPRTPPNRQRRLLLALLLVVLGLVVTGIFGLRTWRQYAYTQRVARGEVQVETLRGWMTLSYIERVYGVPEAEQRAALGLPATGFEDRSLREWLAAQGMDAKTGRRTIEALILQRGAVGAKDGRAGSPP